MKEPLSNFYLKQENIEHLDGIQAEKFDINSGFIETNMGIAFLCSFNVSYIIFIPLWHI